MLHPDLLAQIAIGGPDMAFEFVTWRGPAAHSACWSRSDLALQVARAAGAITARTQHGDRVIVALPPGLDFVSVFLGCLTSGRIAVPAPTPATARARAVLTSLAATTDAALVLTETIAGDAIASVAPNADDIAYLQFTSGSTQAPRGAVVTYGALAANLAAIGEAWGLTPSDRGVFWLPPFHDMGLVGAILAPVAFGFPATLMHPAAFLQRPGRWLDLIHARRATFSGAPNFAYDLCVARAASAARDLSSWRVAVNGAEPVSATTMRRFSARFAAEGFRPDAMAPGYGLAEAVLFVTAGRYREPCSSPVSCGSPGKGIVVRIVDEVRGLTLPEGETGAIWVAGPTLASGYWNAPEDNAFGARLEGEPHSFLRTGDIGFLRGGELHVCGRAKDVIVRAGRKAHAADLEHAIAGRVGGRSAAFAVAGDPERLVIVHEPQADGAMAHAAIVDALGADFDLIADDIVLAAPGAVRFTTSGKVARAATRAAYLAGAFARGQTR